MMRSGKRSWNPELSTGDLGEEDLEDYDDILGSDDPQQYQVSKRGDNSKGGDNFIRLKANSFQFKLTERIATNN